MLAGVLAVLGLAGVALAAPAAAEPTCGGRTATIVGRPQQGDGSYSDPISGTSGADVIVGTTGDDLIYGNGGYDTICALDGRDFVHGGSGGDCIYGGPGNDHMTGDSGRDLMMGGAGDDYLNGYVGHDTLYGDARGSTSVVGRDVIDGHGGDDRLIGGPGGDRWLGGGPGSDLILGLTGNDVLAATDGAAIKGDDDLRGGHGQDLVQFGAEASAFVDFGRGFARVETSRFELRGLERVLGSFEDDIIRGSSQTTYTEVLRGGAGHDTIHGFGGRDFIAGGYGNDSMFGGPGPDNLVGYRGTDRADGGRYRDICRAEVVQNCETVRADTR